MSSQDPTPHPWQLVSSEPGPDLLVGRARFDTVRNPRTGEAHRRFVLESPPWVNVVARTPTGAFVLVRQFRFGTASLTLEIPGGVVDPGEDPLACAKRELAEETGYTSPSWTKLATVAPNPAFLTGACHQFLAEGCRRTAEPSLDPGEDIAVELFDEAEILAAVRSGEIDHSLVLCALARVLDLRV